MINVGKRLLGCWLIIPEATAPGLGSIGGIAPIPPPKGPGEIGGNNGGCACAGRGK